MTSSDAVSGESSRSLFLKTYPLLIAASVPPPVQLSIIFSSFDNNITVLSICDDNMYGVMEFITELNCITKKFMKDYPLSLYPELMYKQGRPYNCLLIDLYTISYSHST